MQLIGLNGRALSGKDTAFHFIREAAEGLCVERICFADKMKLSGVRALGFDPATTEEAVAIADQIKASGHVITSWTEPSPKLSFDEFITGGGSNKLKTVKSKTVTGREFWQRYGTEAHREVYGQDFHVDALLPHDQADLEKLFPDVDVLVETTTRFPNEAQRILDLGGTVWHIDADARLGPLPDDAHVSEHPLPSEYITLHVRNNLSLQQFQIGVRAAYELSSRA